MNKSGFKSAKQIGRVKEHVVELSEAEEARAMDLHRKSIVFDLHMHSVVLPEDPSDFGAWERSPRKEVGYEGIKKGGITACLDGFSGWAHIFTMDANVREIGLRWCDMDHNYDKVIRGLRAEDVRRAKRENKTAIFLITENSEMICNDLDGRDMLYGLGLRGMGLSYNKRNLVGDGRTERTDSGLSKFGIQVIERLNKLGVIVDLAHCGERMTLEAAEFSKDPIIVSHTGARGVHPTERMASDEELQAVAATGGLIGIHSGVGILSSANRQTVEDIINHIDYCVKLVGIDHVAIGSDNYFGDKLAMLARIMKGRAEDGLQGYVSFTAPYMEGMENPSEWPNYTRALVKRGYSDQDIQKIIGGNTLRIVERVVG